MHSLVLLTKALLYLSVWHVEATPQRQYVRATKPVAGFMLVSGRLLTGNLVSYAADLSKCNQLYGYNNDDFTNPFGGSIDVFELTNDRSVAELPFVVFSSIRSERNETNGMVLVHRKINYTSDESVDVTVSVMTPDYNLMFSSKTFSCDLKTNPTSMKFFTNQNDAEILTKYDSLLEALKNGERVRFSTQFRICQGALIASNFGGEIKGYDVHNVESNITKIVTTLETLNRTPDGGLQNHILYGETFSNGIIYFIDSLTRPFSKAGQDTNIQCFMQQDRPGGSVEYFMI